MGNSSSSSSRGHHDESVDYGALVPQGVYTGPQDWNQSIVSQLIVSRRLAPFYRPLEDYDESWDDDQILAARKELPNSDQSEQVTRTDHSQTNISSAKYKRPGSLKEPAKPEAQVYRGAVECPICFLYYPPNINRSRCCDQAICTECFVQIKRSEPTTTHLVSEPAACPYCVRDNFGVVYTPPPWRSGLGSEHGGILSETQRSRSPTETMPPPSHKRRQKSYGADSPEVVLIDHIRPDWEAKLEAVRATVTRRANRRIIMRQVGDRLIPVGVTSGRVHALSSEEVAAAAASVENGSRRRRGRGPGGDALEQLMGMTGTDLEELMLMEAMRLSMVEHEEQERKQAEEKRKREAAEVVTSASWGELSSLGRPGPSTNGAVPFVINPLTADARALLTTSSSNLSVSSSSRGRTTPTDQTGKNSRSISRSRTPPANPVLPLNPENQAAWRSRAEGPLQFSTLSAALTTASTAAAVFGDSNPNATSASQTAEPPSTSCALSIPTITIAQESAQRPALNHSTEADRSSTYSDAPLPPLPVEPVPSTLSSTSTDEPSTSGSTSTSSSFGSLENGTRIRADMGSGGPESSSRTSLLESDVPGIRKPVVMETSTAHFGDKPFCGAVGALEHS